MADRLLNTTYLFVSSRSSPDPGRVTLEIPEDSIKCRQDEYIKLTLVQHVMQNDIPNVDGVSAIQVTIPDMGSTNITIPRGHYRLAELEQHLDSAFTYGVQFQYLPTQMVWQFQSVQACTLTFQGPLAYLFGARPWDRTLDLPPQTWVPCRYSVVPRAINDLCVHLTGVLPGPPVNISNLGSPDGLLNTSTLMAIIPLRAQPGALNVFSNISDVAQMQIYDPDIQRLVLITTDVEGAPIPDMPHYTAVIKVDVYRRPGKDAVVEMLSGIMQLVRIFVLKLAVSEQDPADPEEPSEVRLES